MPRPNSIADRALDIATVILCMPWSAGAPPRDVGLCAGDLTTAALKYWQDREGSPEAMRRAVVAMMDHIRPLATTDDRLPAVLSRLEAVLADLDRAERTRKRARREAGAATSWSAPCAPVEPPAK